MKNKKIIIVLFVVIIVIATSLIIVLLLHKNHKDSPETDTNSFQTVIQNEWDQSIPDDAPEFLNALNRKSTFSVSNYTDDGEGFYTVNVQVTAPDISKTIAALDKQYADKTLSEEEMNATVLKLIENAKDKTTEQVVYIVRDTDNKYHVQFTEDFLSAMFGYFLSDSISGLFNNDKLIA